MTINSMISTVPNLQYASSYASNEQSYNNNIDQIDTISSIVSQYDPNNLTTEDATAIASAFSENGIKPSQELSEALDSLGFDAQEIGTLAGVVAPRPNSAPPPPPPSKEEQDEVSNTLQELLSSSDEDSSTTNAFDEILDYTSRIVNLNDNSKDKVNELFEQYAPSNTELSKEDASTVIKNSLSQIFSDSNNYKSVSFYA